jgi:hypothetical protein
VVIHIFIGFIVYCIFVFIGGLCLVESMDYFCRFIEDVYAEATIDLVSGSYLPSSSCVTQE